MSVSCPACAVGFLAWSIAKSLIDTIFMYAEGESTGAIAGSLTFDAITLGALTGFGFDGNIVHTYLKENIWLGLETLCTTLKLSRDVSRTVEAISDGEVKELKDEDI